MQLAYALTATDMRMRENDVTLGIPKSSYMDMFFVQSLLVPTILLMLKYLFSSVPGNTKCV